MRPRLLFCACLTGLISAGFGGGAAYADGLWMHQQLKNPQTGQLLDMSSQTDYGRGRTVAVVCDVRDRLLLVTVPKTALSPEAIAYRVDDGSWIEGGWEADGTRFFLAGDAAKRAVGLLMMGAQIELRLGDQKPVAFFAEGLLDTLSKHYGRCTR